MHTFESPRVKRFSYGMRAIGIFLLFGASMAFLAGTTLTWQGTWLDRIWILNPQAYKQLVAYGKMCGIPFLLLGLAMVIAGVAWLKRRVWGWRMAVFIIATQVLGDLVNALMGDIFKGLAGFIIAGAFLVYLLSGRVRTAFVSGRLASKQTTPKTLS